MSNPACSSGRVFSSISSKSKENSYRYPVPHGNLLSRSSIEAVKKLYMLNAESNKEVRKWVRWSTMPHTPEEIRSKLSMENIENVCVSYICRYSEIPEWFIEEFILLGTGVLYELGYKPIIVAFNALRDTIYDPGSTKEQIIKITEEIFKSYRYILSKKARKTVLPIENEIMETVQNSKYKTIKKDLDHVQDCIDAMWKKAIYENYVRDLLPICTALEEDNDAETTISRLCKTVKTRTWDTRRMRSATTEEIIKYLPRRIDWRYMCNYQYLPAWIFAKYSKAISSSSGSEKYLYFLTYNELFGGLKR